MHHIVAIFSVAPPGLAHRVPEIPRLTPWAKFLRRSAPPEWPFSAGKSQRDLIIQPRVGPSHGLTLGLR